MKDIDMAMLVDGVAKVISGAPFPSKQSLSKARKAVEFVLAAPALDLPSLAKIEKLRAENQEFREDVDRWTGEVGRLTAERDQLHADKQHYLAEALRWSTEAVRLQALLHDAQFNIQKLRKAMDYALAQHQRPRDFSPQANHWSCVLFNALGEIDAAKSADNVKGEGHE